MPGCGWVEGGPAPAMLLLTDTVPLEGRLRCSECLPDERKGEGFSARVHVARAAEEQEGCRLWGSEPV